MADFSGFPEGKVYHTPLPNLFFTDLLPKIDDLTELKLTLYIFLKLGQMEGAFRYLLYSDLAVDEQCMQMLASSSKLAPDALDDALHRCVSRGTLIHTDMTIDGEVQTLYFLNSPKGRAAIRAIEAGRWRSTGTGKAPIEIQEEPPNIFTLYEENIGPLTPMIADALGEAQDSYPAGWIEDAIRIAVERNKRSWRYAEAILDRWQREGRNDKEIKQENRRDTAEARRRYIEGEYSDFVEH